MDHPCLEATPPDPALRRPFTPFLPPISTDPPATRAAARAVEALGALERQQYLEGAWRSRFAAVNAEAQKSVEASRGTESELEAAMEWCRQEQRRVVCVRIMRDEEALVERQELRLVSKIQRQAQRHAPRIGRPTSKGKGDPGQRTTAWRAMRQLQSHRASLGPLRVAAQAGLPRESEGAVLRDRGATLDPAKERLGYAHTNADLFWAAGYRSLALERGAKRALGRHRVAAAVALEEQERRRPAGPPPWLTYDDPDVRAEEQERDVAAQKASHAQRRKESKASRLLAALESRTLETDSSEDSGSSPESASDTDPDSPAATAAADRLARLRLDLADFAASGREGTPSPDRRERAREGRQGLLEQLRAPVRPKLSKGQKIVRGATRAARRRLRELEDEEEEARRSDVGATFPETVLEYSQPSRPRSGAQSAPSVWPQLVTPHDSDDEQFRVVHLSPPVLERAEARVHTQEPEGFLADPPPPPTPPEPEPECPAFLALMRPGAGQDEPTPVLDAAGMKAKVHRLVAQQRDADIHRRERRRQEEADKAVELALAADAQRRERRRTRRSRKSVALSLSPTMGLQPDPSDAQGPASTEAPQEAPQDRPPQDRPPQDSAAFAASPTMGEVTAAALAADGGVDAVAAFAAAAPQDTTPPRVGASPGYRQRMRELRLGCWRSPTTGRLPSPMPMLREPLHPALAGDLFAESEASVTASQSHATSPAPSRPPSTISSRPRPGPMSRSSSRPPSRPAGTPGGLLSPL